MLVSISVNVYRCCGCKSTTFIYISKPFYYIISIFFISHWYGGFYKTKFFCLFAGFGRFCLFWVGFATKAPGHEVLIFPFYWTLLAFEKDTKLGFGWICLFWVGFATKAPGHEVLIFPFYWALLAFEKDTKLVFTLLSKVLLKTQRRKVFFLSL